MYLEKRLPMGDDVGKEDIENCMSTIQVYINDSVDSLNSTSDIMFQSLDVAQTQVEEVVLKLTNVASKLHDIYSITGNTQDSGDVYSGSVQTKMAGCEVDRGTRTIQLSQSSKDHRIVESIKASSNGGQPGNQTGQNVTYDNVNNLIGQLQRFEYEKFNDELLLSLDIQLDDVYPVNLIEFTIHNLGVKLPQIAQIEYQVDGVNWEFADIKLSNRKQIDLEMFEFKNGKVSLHTQTHLAKYVNVKFHQQYPYIVYGSNKTRYAIAIQDMRIMQYSAIESGEVIIGPFEFTDQVLKASVQADVDQQAGDLVAIKVFLSNDAINWYQVENSKIFNPSSAIQKVVDFNTVSSKAIQTTQPVMKIWLKVAMTGQKVSRDLDVANSLLRDVGSIQNEERDIELQSDSQNIAVFKSLNFKYGGTVPAASSSTSQQYGDIVNIMDDEEQYVKGFGIESQDGRVFDVTKNLSKGNITYSLDKVHVVEKERVYIYPTHDADPSQIVLYKVQRPYRKKVNVQLKVNKYELKDHMIVFPVKNFGGNYTVKTKYGQIQIDLRSRFFTQNLQALYVLPDDVKEVELLDHVGVYMGTFKTVVVNGKNCISLLNMFFVVKHSIPGRVLNPYYPISKLEDKEFAIENGKLLMGSFYSGEAQVNCVRMQVMEHETQFGTSNKPYIISDSQMPIKTDYMIQQDELVKYVKLADSNVLEGQIKIDASMANFNPFVKEVKYIDGKSEFSSRNVHTQKHNLALGQINLLSQYAGGDIKFYGYRRPFQNQVFSTDELVKYGDWFLQETSYSSSGQVLQNAKILLPPGVKTDSVLDVDIEYDIMDRSASTTGQYSVDYVNGIIHASSYIDPKVKIQYQCTNIFARYEALEWVPTTAYQKKESSIRINDYQDDIAGTYIVVQKTTSDSSVELIESPIVKECKINVVTERDFV